MTVFVFIIPTTLKGVNQHICATLCVLSVCFRDSAENLIARLFIYFKTTCLFYCFLLYLSSLTIMALNAHIYFTFCVQRFLAVCKKRLIKNFHLRK